MRWVRAGLVAVVSSVWLAGYILSYVKGTPQPTELSLLMAPVLGWAFSGTIIDAVKAKRAG